MNREEHEGKWDEGDEMVQAKWGRLTRSQRTVVSGRRTSHDVKLHELHGISEEDIERAIVLDARGP